MERVTLRKLTRKSIIGFGKHSDMSVGQLIDFQKTPYLRWVYFNMSNIDFMPEILDEIHVPDEYRIANPGKKPEYADIVYDLNQDGISALEKHKNKLQRNASSRVKGRLAVMNANYSKAYLRSKNQWK